MWISWRSICKKSGSSLEFAEHQALLKFNRPLEAFNFGRSEYLLLAASPLQVQGTLKQVTFQRQNLEL